MQFGKMGVFCFADMLDKTGCAEVASRVEELGYSTLWYPEALGYEAFGIGGYLLGQSKTLQVGSGIANRAVAAKQIRTIFGRHIAGFDQVLDPEWKTIDGR